MKIGILTNVLCNLPLKDALSYFKSVNIEMVEIVSGGTGGAEHCDASVLLEDESKFQEFKRTIERSGLSISGFACHCNPVHPVKSIAERFDKAITDSILLAEKLGVDTIIAFSGCPGDHEGAKYPNWCTSVWPYDFMRVLDYQWNEVLNPYWRKIVKFARMHHVKKIALEMHPAFSVYNPKTLLQLRENCGEEIGANFDPSHLIWQGIDCPTAILNLRGAIYNFHAKDTFVSPMSMGRSGFFDPYGDYTDEQRAFKFRIPGSGTDELHWKRMMTALKDIGYDGALSIEHEDGSMGQDEGIRRSVEFLSRIIIRDKDKGCWWKNPVKEFQMSLLPE